MGNGEVAFGAQAAHAAEAQPVFCNMKQLTVLRLPSELDASPSQGTN